MALNINLSNAYSDQNILSNIKGTEVSASENITGKTEITSEANLKNLLIGDVFSGEILDITGHNVEILLGESGQKLSATMQQALELNIGEKLLFQVKDKNDNQVVLRPIANNGVSMELVNKSLNAAGFSVTDKNVAIVKELIANGQPIDRNSILNIIKFSSQFENESIDKLVNMTKLGIEITGDNLEQFDKYTSSNYHISENITGISNEVGEVISEAVINGNIKESLKDIGELFEKIAKSTEGEINNSEEAGKDKENIDIKSNIYVELGYDADENTEGLNKETNNIINRVEETKAEKNQFDGTGVNITEKKEGVNDNKEVNNPQLEGAREMLEKADSFQKLSAAIKLITKSEFSEKDLEELLKPEKIKDKIRNIFEKELFVDVKELEEKDDLLKDKIKDIYNKLDKIADAVKESNIAAKNENILDGSKNIKNNIAFLKELNNIESFVQIPIKLSSGEGNGDLYVLNRKRNKSKNDNMLTAFLHLDLEHLGATDINITMENYTSQNSSVTTRFTLADEAAVNLVEEHLGELKERLKKLGYKVNISVEKTESGNEKYNPLSKIESNNYESVKIKRYSLDIRT